MQLLRIQFVENSRRGVRQDHVDRRQQLHKNNKAKRNVNRRVTTQHRSLINRTLPPPDTDPSLFKFKWCWSSDVTLISARTTHGRRERSDECAARPAVHVYCATSSSAGRRSTSKNYTRYRRNPPIKHTTESTVRRINDYLCKHNNKSAAIFYKFTAVLTT